MMKMKTKSDIQARLTVYGMSEMKSARLQFFRKWIMAVAKEMQKAKPSDYSKIYRATLYKP